LIPHDTKRMLPVTAEPLPTRGQPRYREPLLELRGVSKWFGALAAVKELSFEMRAGEILGLIGPNGAGKSTVFNLMTGVLPAGERRVRYEAAQRLDQVGLRRRTFDAAGTLPLGSQRMLEVARALCADPVLLLLDEPAAGLRYLEKKALGELVQALRRSGLSIL